MSLLLSFVLFISTSFAVDVSSDVCKGDRQVKEGAGFMDIQISPEVQKCMDHFDDGAAGIKRKSTSNPEQCIKDCSTTVGRHKCTKANLEALVAKCTGDYNCGNKGACRVSVDDLISCKKTKDSDCAEVAKACRESCTEPSGNNCIEDDKRDFQFGREICATGSPAKPLIPDATVRQIIDQRGTEISNRSQAAPTSELAKSSIFYGGSPSEQTADAKSSSTQSAGASSGDSSNTAASNGGTTSGTGQPQGFTPAAAAGATSGGSAGGFAPVALSSGGNSSSGSGFGGSAGFQDTSGADSKSTSLDAVGNATLTSDNFSGTQWPDAPAARTYGGSTAGSTLGGGASASGSMFGGAKGVTDAGGLRTAAVRDRSNPSSLESSTFQSGFHKASGGKPLGMSQKSKHALASFGKNKKKPKNDGAMNLSQLLGRKKRTPRGLAGNKNFATSGFDNPNIGSGSHSVFTNVDSYFEKLRLDANGEIDL